MKEVELKAGALVRILAHDHHCWAGAHRKAVIGKVYVVTQDSSLTLAYLSKNHDLITAMKDLEVLDKAKLTELELAIYGVERK